MDDCMSAYNSKFQGVFCKKNTGEIWCLDISLTDTSLNGHNSLKSKM